MAGKGGNALLEGALPDLVLEMGYHFTARYFFYNRGRAQKSIKNMKKDFMQQLQLGFNDSTQKAGSDEIKKSAKS